MPKYGRPNYILIRSSSQKVLFRYFLQLMCNNEISNESNSELRKKVCLHFVMRIFVYFNFYRKKQFSLLIMVTKQNGWPEPHAHANFEHLGMTISKGGQGSQSI